MPCHVTEPRDSQGRGAPQPSARRGGPPGPESLSYEHTKRVPAYDIRGLSADPRAHQLLGPHKSLLNKAVVCQGLGSRVRGPPGPGRGSEGGPGSVAQGCRCGVVVMVTQHFSSVHSRCHRTASADPGISKMAALTLAFSLLLLASPVDILEAVGVEL
ncbi:unnamed protein product [Boreogadus saida]